MREEVLAKSVYRNGASEVGADLASRMRLRGWRVLQVS